MLPRMEIGGNSGVWQISPPVITRTSTGNAQIRQQQMMADIIVTLK